MHADGVNDSFLHSQVDGKRMTNKSTIQNTQPGPAPQFKESFSPVKSIEAPPSANKYNSRTKTPAGGRPRNQIPSNERSFNMLSPSPNIGGREISPIDGRDMTRSSKAAARVRNGLDDLKVKMAAMKEKREAANREMMEHLEEYEKNKAMGK